MIKRFSWLVLPFVMFLLWLLLNDSVTAGQIVIGLALSVIFAIFIPRVRPLRAQLKKPAKALLLLWHVICDIVRSNITVAFIILGPPERRKYPGFMCIPLEMKDPHGLAVLSMIITATPGTVWAEISPDCSVLTLHVLELKDEAAWVYTIKQRYEVPLMEIFE